MRRFNLLPILFAALLLTACASSAPSLVAGAEVTFDRCGQPVVLTRVDGVPAGGDWQADTIITVYRPCRQGQHLSSSPEPGEEGANNDTKEP